MENKKNDMNSIINYQPIDIITIISNNIFNNGLNKQNFIELIKKIIITFFIKYAHDNLFKIFPELFTIKYLKIFILKCLALIPFIKIIKLKINDNIKEIKSNKSLDSVSLANELKISNINEENGMFFSKCHNSLCLINSTAEDLDIITLSNSLEKKILEKNILKNNLNKFKTEYSILTIKDDAKEPKLIWMKPARINKFYDESKYNKFFNMIKKFADNSYILNDSSTIFFNINGKPGVGKSSILDHIYELNICNQILKINFENFIDFNDDLEKIIKKSKKKLTYIKALAKIQLF